MVLRSRFAEDRLAASAERGISQYVIVATGLDTFPWRQPPFARDMRIFATDFPASLAWTRERFRERGLHQPSNLTFVPVDLEDRQLGQQLLRFGFASNEPMFCSALGIVQFLTPDAVDALLMFAASAPPGSEIAFSFSPPDDALEEAARIELHRSIARGETFGEPWLTRLHTHEVIGRLRHLGFTEVVHLTPDQVQKRYVGSRLDGLTISGGSQVIAGIV